jgi:hypothetical protein
VLLKQEDFRRGEIESGRLILVLLANNLTAIHIELTSRQRSIFTNQEL